MNKILFVNSPIRSNALPNLIPTGPGILCNHLMRHNIEVDFWDLNQYRPVLTNDEIKEQLEATLCDVNLVMISGLITTYKAQKNISKMIKEIKPNAVIIAGGSCASSVPSLLLEKTDIDCVVIGEGEDAILEIVADYSQGNLKKYYDPKGLKLPLSEYPWPCWDNINMDVYLKNPFWGPGSGNLSTITTLKQDRSINIIATRGCPWRCNFCAHSLINYSTRNTNDVINEIATLINKYNVTFIGFVDDNILCNKSWLIELCLKLKPLSIKWGAHARADMVDEEILSVMYSSGCVYLGFGIESWSPIILKRWNKKLDIAKAVKGIWLCREFGIFPNCTYIFGDKEDTVSTLTETSRMMYETKTMNQMFWLTPYPGTTLWKDYYSNGQIITPWEKIGFESYIERLADAQNYTVNLTRWPLEEAIYLKKLCENGDL